jgi:GNAT superfamily N-acetyltransferase
MPSTDPDSLALKVNRLQRWFDAGEATSTAVTHYFDHAHAVATVDPSSTSGAASFNRNRIRLCGGRGLSGRQLREMAQLFDTAGVARFFVWLSPGPGLEIVREWLAAEGAARVPWTRYPTMLHSGRDPVRATTTLQVRKVTRDDFDRRSVAQGDISMEGYLESIGRTGFHPFAAFEGGRPIATAALVQVEEIGYLTYAHTAELFRRRGAQSALIAARIEEARKLDCKMILTETLTMLKDSYANLTRAGFEVVYEKEVYECVRPSASRLTHP